MRIGIRDIIRTLTENVIAVQLNIVLDLLPVTAVIRSILIQANDGFTGGYSSSGIAPDVNWVSEITGSVHRGIRVSVTRSAYPSLPDLARCWVLGLAWDVVR